jgi:hypothetical protein
VTDRCTNMHIMCALPLKEKSKLGYLLVLRWGIWECNKALIAAKMPKSAESQIAVIELRESWPPREYPEDVKRY